MKRFLTLALAGALVLGMGSVAYANICAFDPVPAATLLFPFVTYNYDNGIAGNGATTLWSITNVSSEAQIVHVTLWTDYSVPILDFNILLTGYDMQNWNIRDTLRDGRLPATFSVVHSTSEGIVQDGPWSTRNSAVTANPPNPADPESTYKFTAPLGTCAPTNDSYPGKYQTQTIQANIRALFQAWLQSSQTAQRAFTDCLGTYFSLVPSSWFEARTTADDTWMYITMDVVDRCNKLFPDNSAYYAGVIQNQNVLVGDYTVVDTDQRFSEVDNAVHIEADAQIASVATPSPNDPTVGTTFYARYSNQTPGVSDYREPLPTAFSVRYQNKLLGDGSMLQTFLRVFKTNTSIDYQIVPDLQTVLPDGIQATQLYSRVCLAYTYYTWDDEENVQISSTVPWSAPTGEEVVPNLLPLETQEVNADQFDLVGEDGWMLFVWPFSNGATYAGHDLQYQVWMGVKYVKEGSFSGARDAQVLANYNCFATQVLPNLGINYDYVP